MAWTKYTVTVNLPETVMIRFLIKPNAKSENGNQWPKSVNETDVTYWFDEFSFEKVD